MSEYQYVIFQAVDSPLDDEQLEFARRQSTRAEVSRWSLAAEYHYSSFRGDVEGLLRRGYDVYLEDSNYNGREIKLRLQRGLPFAQGVWEKYVDGERLGWKCDAQGPGGILSLNPFLESEYLHEIFDPQTCLDTAVQIRHRLMSGDLRALYLLWLCAANDDYNDPEEMIEPPVPHGLAELGDFGSELLAFFGLDRLVLAAAGQNVNAAPPDQSRNLAARWVNAQPEQPAKEMLLQLLTGDTEREKARLLAEIRDSQPSGDWPTSDKRRTLAELLRVTAALRAEAKAEQARLEREEADREAEKQARERAARMREMRQDRDLWLRESERLVAAGGTQNYKAAAELLHDLREAVGGEEGAGITRRQAEKLAKKHPKLNHLKSSLRKRGLLG